MIFAGFRVEPRPIYSGDRRMNNILIEVLLVLAVPALLGVVYALSFNSRFNSWREGRQTWREMARFRKRRHALKGHELAIR